MSEVTVRAEASGQAAGAVGLRVALRKRALPQQPCKVQSRAIRDFYPEETR